MFCSLTYIYKKKAQTVAIGYVKITIKEYLQNKLKIKFNKKYFSHKIFLI